MSTAFVPEWRTAGENTQDPAIGTGRLEGQFDDTALSIVLEWAEDTVGGVDRWVFQLPNELEQNWYDWNPNGEARGFDAADGNQQYVALATLDRMRGTIECWTGNDSIGWGATHPFPWSSGSSLHILLVPRGQVIPAIVGE